MNETLGAVFFAGVAVGALFGYLLALCAPADKNSTQSGGNKLGPPPKSTSAKPKIYCKACRMSHTKDYAHCLHRRRRQHH
ncbi:hypothetical protein GR11A_00108 [Vibrio phage vB_VcorM_GR11A]|nr:hypothetical protein GR11A_00108 [Vibrio phage vB_VcorM_GR11A]